MDVREFRYLLTIADLGSITKAANQLYVTQSALSKFVQNKEAEMGTPLFSRIGKQFVPTFAGEKCVEAARRILSINRKLDEEVEQIAKQGKGRVRLAFHPSWSDYFFQAIYPRFCEQHPHVDLQLFEVGSAQALVLMDNAELDIAIITASWDRHSRFACEVLRTQRMVLAVAEGHPLLEKAIPMDKFPYPVIDPALLEGLPFIMRHAQQMTRVYAMALLHELGITPHIVLESASRENALRAVEHGLGLTFTLDDPTWLLAHPGLRYLCYEEKDPTENYVNIIYNKGTQFSNVEDDLLVLIKNSYRMLA